MTTLADFTARLDFRLDDFQRQACEALAAGHGVLVCAPTGAGKTIVGEFAVHLALASGTKCFYTTPIKALSNQKFHDLVAIHGAGNVGLLTGDNSINADAPVVVMTTEVVRNMIYAQSPTLNGLSYVVMDEVHFLADRFRGAVWEEVILHLDPSVRVVSLSATVSNSEEFGAWIQTVRGDTTVIVDEIRPVPLWQHMLVGNRLFDLYDPRTVAEGGKRVNPELTRYIAHRDLSSAGERDDRRGPRTRGRDRGRGRAGGQRGGTRPVSRPEMVVRLDRDGLLPAIDFIFSRAGCDGALAQCVRSGINLLDDEQRQQALEIADRYLAELSPVDAEVLGADQWRLGIGRGFAAHHAGLLPTFRHAVEELFVRGLVRVVFATETLALGINMPARSVVLERLVKYNGEAHVDLTPGEFTQLTGRAGRRGIDTEGHAVVVWTPQMQVAEVAGLAGARTFALRSSFTPEYNMAVNLIDRLGLDGSRELLLRSFAQFQADRSVVGRARKLDGLRHSLRKVDGELARAAQQRGIEEAVDDDADYQGFVGYMELREDIRRRERELRFARRDDAQLDIGEALAGLKRGQIIGLYGNRHRGTAVVVEPAENIVDPKPMVLAEDGWCGRVGVRDFLNAPEVLGNMRLARHVDRRTGRGRRDLASALRATGVDLPKGKQRKRAAAADDAELARMRAQLRAHPAHRTADDEELVRLAQQRNRLLREVRALDEEIAQRTSELSITFDKVVAVLSELGYLADETVTDAGMVLRSIYSESDLLVSECLREGVWRDLAPRELAAVVASLVYTSRRESAAAADRLPGSAALRGALADTNRIWRDLVEVEMRHGVSPTREPDTGFSVAVAMWASGRSLAESLMAAGEAGQLLSPGDFVRWNRQVIDLLDQIAGCAGPGDGVGRAAIAAIGAIRRGVVAVEIG
ncbi:DEAD/DEAH box helicase [Gordonia sp. UBA7599]|uniref:DEAD/DEAH box helicase n=3 Tax=Gordonia TaxID=2053 RepID=UPI000FB433B9|nr:DEAD/DEAH box helicase [Gordonia sp. UBA7599]RUP36611.1 MAG: DEAD/DEAH box helicase [Gordonia sp. (in: high G+C Gram-positive bacteria)]HNP56023.1 DEAD/DEAH box helicase [Gordonia sp. (in: high G+C Gram-positive bacteria)]